MRDSKKKESSDSEDEFNIEALEEAVDKQLFKNLYTSNNQQESKNNEKNVESNHLSKSKVDDEFQSNELPESCKTFIAKKLNERLQKDIVLKSSEIPSESNESSKKNNGIRLFNSSTSILSKDSCNNLKGSVKRKNLSDSCNQKEHKLKCKQVTINTDKVLSQSETYHWTNRKPPKKYSYKKLANGKLLEMK